MTVGCWAKTVMRWRFSSRKGRAIVTLRLSNDLSALRGSNLLNETKGSGRCEICLYGRVGFRSAETYIPHSRRHIRYHMTLEPQIITLEGAPDLGGSLAAYSADARGLSLAIG